MVDLGLQRGDSKIGETVGQGEPQVGIGLHHDLGVVVRPRGATFDEVARNGEWCASKSNQRDVEFGDEIVDCLEHVWRVSFGVEWTETGEVIGRLERVLDDGADAGHNIETKPDRVGRRDDVGVQDCGVDAVTADGLQGDLGSEIWVGDRVVDAAWSADLSVLGQRPASLTHEPHRCDVVRFASASGEEAGIGFRGHPISVRASAPAGTAVR